MVLYNYAMVMLIHTKYRKCPYMEFLVFTTCILIIIIGWLYINYVYYINVRICHTEYTHSF